MSRSDGTFCWHANCLVQPLGHAFETSMHEYGTAPPQWCDKILQVALLWLDPEEISNSASCSGGLEGAKFWRLRWRSVKCWVFGHGVHSSAFMSSPSKPPREACFELAGQPAALTSAKCSVSFAVAWGAQYSRPTVTVRLRELRSCSRNSAHLSSAKRPFSATCGAWRDRQQGYMDVVQSQ